jgi:hypothetical protein
MYEILREIQQGHKETPKEIQKSIEIAGFQEVFPSFRRFSVPFFFSSAETCRFFRVVVTGYLRKFRRVNPRVADFFEGCRMGIWECNKHTLW